MTGIKGMRKNQRRRLKSNGIPRQEVGSDQNVK